MDWNELYPRPRRPEPGEIAGFVASPLWPELLSFLSETCGGRQRTEYSSCSMAPGWNVKYRARGRALCTLYPGEGEFTCLVALGVREEPGMEEILPRLEPEIRELYHSAGGIRGTRWLMIPVRDSRILASLKELLLVRLNA